MKEKRKERLFLKRKQSFSWKIFHSQTEDPLESYCLYKCVNELVAVITLLLSVVLADKTKIAFSTSLFSYYGTIISIVAKYTKRRDTNLLPEVLHNFFIFNY